MAEIRVLLCADKARAAAEKLFANEFFNQPITTPADAIKAHADRIRELWVVRKVNKP